MNLFMKNRETDASTPFKLRGNDANLSHIHAACDLTHACDTHPQFHMHMHLAATIFDQVSTFFLNQGLDELFCVKL